MKNLLIGVCALAFGSAPAFAQAADVNPWLLRAGVANLQLQDDLTYSVGGAPVPGAALHFHQIYTPMMELGYYFDEDFAAVATLGFPPAITASGGGSIAAYGKLLSTTFGPSAFTVQYQPIHDGIFRPYAGIGVSYMIIFSTHAQLVQNPTLSNDLAPAFELGSEIALNDSFSFFVEGKKALLESKTTGTISGYPATGKATIAPWVFSLGVSTRF
jgi:outer membrane protein